MEHSTYAYFLLASPCRLQYFKECRRHALCLELLELSLLLLQPVSSLCSVHAYCIITLNSKEPFTIWESILCDVLKIHHSPEGFCEPQFGSNYFKLNFYFALIMHICPNRSNLLPFVAFLLRIYYYLQRCREFILVSPKERKINQETRVRCCLDQNIHLTPV
jgi:hypothetical protein